MIIHAAGRQADKTGDRAGSVDKTEHRLLVEEEEREKGAKSRPVLGLGGNG